MTDCIFCKIVAGEIPCHKVWEDEQHVAFLDIHPMREGHTLLVPKLHASYLFELDENAYRSLLQAAKTVAGPLKEAMHVPRIGVAVEGFEVDHVHVHLIPLDRGLGAVDFPRTTGDVDHAQLARVSQKIIQNV